MARRKGVPLVGALAVMFLLLFFLGRLPMHFKTQVDIAKPPATIFQALTEPELLVRWMDGLESSTPLTEGGTRLGARSREVMLENGRRIASESTVTALEPDRLLKVAITAPGVRGEIEYRLDPQDDGTRVHYLADLRFSGVAALFAPFMRKAGEARAEGDLGRLKSLVEGR